MGILDFLRGNKKLEPGQRCPESGQYTWSQEPHSQVTCIKDTTMPPPPWGQSRGYWTLTDVTRHKGGR